MEEKETNFFNITLLVPNKSMVRNRFLQHPNIELIPQLFTLTGVLSKGKKVSRKYY